MSAAALQAFTFPAQREPALVRSFSLAFVVHLALIGVMFLGVRVQSRAPETVTVDLVELAPPPPPVVEAPKPPPVPVVEPPKVEPAPPPKPPDIAVLEKKPKPKPKPVAKPEPKRDRAFERQLREQLAAEQKAVVEQQAIAESQRQERALKALLAKQQADARAKAIAAWTDKIRAKVRSKIILPRDIVGDPEAVFAVSLLPTGEVLGTPRMTKSSGNKAYDEAVERAIIGSSPLPMPDDRSVFQRELELRFRPKDKPS